MQKSFGGLQWEAIVDDAHEFYKKLAKFVNTLPKGQMPKTDMAIILALTEMIKYRIEQAHGAEIAEEFEKGFNKLMTEITPFPKA
jgi:hypothetical protein